VITLPHLPTNQQNNPRHPGRFATARAAHHRRCPEGRRQTVRRVGERAQRPSLPEPDRWPLAWRYRSLRPSPAPPTPRSKNLWMPAPAQGGPRSPGPYLRARLTPTWPVGSTRSSSISAWLDSKARSARRSYFCDGEYQRCIAPREVVANASQAGRDTKVAEAARIAEPGTGQQLRARRRGVQSRAQAYVFNVFGWLAEAARS
jgi:hypothetical protein